MSNGVHPGNTSILSLKLFEDGDLSKALKESKIGCMIDEVDFNQLFYADDLCLFSTMCNSFTTNA